MQLGLPALDADVMREGWRQREKEYPLIICLIQSHTATSVLFLPQLSVCLTN
jgi:hypothetical protein